jgi:glutaminyl-tRNA synthetase
LEHQHILLVQEEIDKRLAEILGPKTEADSIKPVKKKKEKPAKVEVGKLMCTIQV